MPGIFHLANCKAVCEIIIGMWLDVTRYIYNVIQRQFKSRYHYELVRKDKCSMFYFSQMLYACTLFIWRSQTLRQKHFCEGVDVI